MLLCVAERGPYRLDQVDGWTALLDERDGAGGHHGGALVVGGLVWHFLEPTDKKSGLRVSPWTTGRASGLTLGGSF